MIVSELIPEKTPCVAEAQIEELDFYTMWQDRFSDTDDIEQQQKEVNELLAMLRKPRTF